MSEPNVLPSITSRDKIISGRRIVLATVVLLVAFGMNLFLDYANCVVPPCLSKSSAYRSVQIGMNLTEAEGVLRRAAVSCPETTHCTAFMFSDFWRDYWVELDPAKGVVREKSFGFRYHGKGLLEFLHILR
jgi:hypothetical protein